MLQCGRQAERLHRAGENPAARRRVGVVGRREAMVVLARPVAIIGDQHGIDSLAHRPPRPGIGVGIDLQMQQTIAQMRRHGGRARAIALVIACADHHPARRERMLADPVLADQRRRDVHVGEAGLRQLVEEQDALAGVGQPVRATADGAAVLDPGHAAQLGGVARREIGVDHGPAKITRDRLHHLGLADAGIAPRHRHDQRGKRSPRPHARRIVPHDRRQHGREVFDVHARHGRLLRGFLDRPSEPRARMAGARARPRRRAAEGRTPCRGRAVARYLSSLLIFLPDDLLVCRAGHCRLLRRGTRGDNSRARWCAHCTRTGWTGSRLRK